MHADADRIYQVIFEYAGRIGREQDHDAILAAVAGMARDLAGAERCSIWLIHPETGELRTRIAHGAEEIRVQAGQGLVGQCVQTGEPSIVNSAASDPRFSGHVDKSTGYRTESILTVPMRGAEGKIIGACQVLNKPGGFSAADADLISFAASFSAQAIENQMLQHERESATRLKRELEIASEVQQRLLPRFPPTTDDLECAAICRPALVVGGDHYNYWSLPGGKLDITLGDVSGKGISAALLMASLQAWLHGLILRWPEDLPTLCSELNRIVHANSSADRYSTLFLAQWDPAMHTLHYVNAGQTAPILYRPRAHGADRVVRLEEGGVPIGLMAKASYRQGTVAFQEGDWLVCFSDGISEALNPAGDEWGEDAIIAMIEQSAESTAPELIAKLMTGALDFAGTAPQFDDMTLVAIRASRR